MRQRVNGASPGDAVSDGRSKRLERTVRSTLGAVRAGLDHDPTGKGAVTETEAVADDVDVERLVLGRAEECRECVVSTTKSRSEKSWRRGQDLHIDLTGGSRSMRGSRWLRKVGSVPYAFGVGA